MDFLKDIVSQIGGDYVSLASDIEENEVFVDTGSYVFNALVSGSIFGGVSQNKITAIAGETSTGKTYFALAVVKNFLDANPEGYCLYFDTEAAITKSLLKSRGIDISRVIVINVVTIEDFRTKALKAVDIYLKTPSKHRKPCFFVLDSLGMLSTNKEIGDALAEKDTRDMTKAALIKGAFRMLTLKLGQANIPMISTNHLYANIGGYGPAKVQAGGCLLAGTKILTRSGYKEIQNVGEDDYVFTKEGEFMKVLQTHHFINKPLLEIEFDDGYKVTCSEEHKFYINGEWVEAKDLISGQAVSSMN